MKSRIIRRLGLLAALILPVATARAEINAHDLAAQVTIIRDNYGVPHIDAPTDAGVAFGMAYVQCEDYFWQLEDTYIMAEGRYAEINGESGLDNDLTNRAFEIVASSKKSYETAPQALKDTMAAFAAGANYYLEKHPEEKPRLITHFEPWHVFAYERNIFLGFLYGEIHVGKGQARRAYEEWRGHVGSNAWALGPSKTKDKEAILYANPHQPYFGYGQFYEAHVRSGEGFNFSGACLFGGPVLSIGHNEYLGWTHTVNEPDCADAWVETFDDPKDPLSYVYEGEHRKAEEWKDVVKVKKTDGTIDERTYTFRKTHHGPIIGKQDDTHYISGMIANLYNENRALQAMQMAKAKNFAEWYKAMSYVALPFFNTMYADRDGNIFYVYNGSIPKRELGFDWTKPVDGTMKKTEWQGIHPLEDLPQTLNPPSAFLQSCNQTPFTVTDEGSPLYGDYPSYMAQDKDDDKRRSKMSRKLLRDTHDITYDGMQELALDTSLFWPMSELPKYARELEKLKQTNPTLAEQVQPYLAHLLDWDYKNSNTSTQSTLCVEWYLQLYDGFYPGETLKKEYLNNYEKRFEALVKAAERLKQIYGDWKVQWGTAYVLQRKPNVADMIKVPFNDKDETVPCPGVNGPLGVAFTTYYTPPLFNRKKHYAIVGNSFMGVYQFGPKVKAVTLLQFGESGRPDSPHFFDQARMLSEKKFKPAYFYWEDVKANAEATYHPGEEAAAKK